jgi:hypothetical protein
MATINQSPSGQLSVTLSGITFTPITLTATPFWESIKNVGSPSVLVVIGGGGGVTPVTPTVGQVWPLGYTSM